MDAKAFLMLAKTDCFGSGRLGCIGIAKFAFCPAKTSSWSVRRSCFLSYRVLDRMAGRGGNGRSCRIELPSSLFESSNSCRGIEFPSSGASELLFESVRCLLLAVPEVIEE